MNEFPLPLKKNTNFVNENKEITLRHLQKLKWIGFLFSFILVIVFLYRPLRLELSELKAKQNILVNELSQYKNFSYSEEIPGSEMLPQILEQYQIELQQYGIKVKSINVEKFVSNIQTQTTLGYAMVRLRLETTNHLPDVLQTLEKIEGRRIILEEIKITQSETKVLIKVYFGLS